MKVRLMARRGIISNVASHLRYRFQNAPADGVIVECSNMLDESLGHFDRLPICFTVDKTGRVTVWPVAALFRQDDVVVAIWVR